MRQLPPRYTRTVTRFPDTTIVRSRGDIVVSPAPWAEPDDRGLVGGLVDGVLEAVALKAPGDDDLIKRVIGLPGETISARDGTVVIDGSRLVEPYLPDTVTTADFGPVTIPRSEEHTSEPQSLMRNSYAVFCLKQKKKSHQHIKT